MSSPVVLKVKCEVFLIRFLEKLYGPQPIAFPKKHDFNNTLDFLLSLRPLDYKEPDYEEKTLSILLPYFETKDVRSYNYLSDFKQRKFEKRIGLYFKIHFHTDMNKLINLGYKKKDALEIFMDEYNLPVDCQDMIEKDYSRYITTRWRMKKKLFRTNINSSDKRQKNTHLEL